MRAGDQNQGALTTVKDRRSKLRALAPTKQSMLKRVAMYRAVPIGSLHPNGQDNRHFPMTCSSKRMRCIRSLSASRCSRVSCTRFLPFNACPEFRFSIVALKRAVLRGVQWQASKTGMIMELNHPGWQDSVENAASVAVDAAIRAETYNGGDALMLVERAAVEGATKAAKEMEIKAEGDGKAGEKELAIAQRVENSAVRAAIMAANEIQAEHNHKLVYMPHAAPVLAAQAMPQAPVQMTAPVQQSMPVQSPAAATMATGMPMLAGGGVLGGVAMANGQTFVPDAVQPVAGMVEGTMYVPE